MALHYLYIHVCVCQSLNDNIAYNIYHELIESFSEIVKQNSFRSFIWKVVI
jgi:hypothetical protein